MAGGPILLPDTNTVNAWAYHDLLVAKARALTRAEKPGVRHIQTALGELIAQMHQRRLFNHMVLTDTIMAELFSIAITPSAKEWKILTRRYGESFEWQYGRGYIAWPDVRNALIYDPKQVAPLPHSTPTMPLIPRKDVAEILIDNHQPLGTWFEFLRRNLAWLEFAPTPVIPKEIEGRGERSIAAYVKTAATVTTLRSPERERHRSEYSPTVNTYVIVTEDIKAFGVFGGTGQEVVVLNNCALVNGWVQTKTALSVKAPKKSPLAALARTIPTPEPREAQTVQTATELLFKFLAREMNISTMGDAHQLHYPRAPGKPKPFDVLMAENLRQRCAALA